MMMPPLLLATTTVMYCTQNATTDKLQRLLNAAARDTTNEKGRSRSEAAYVT